MKERFQQSVLDSTGYDDIAKADDACPCDCQAQQHVRAVGGNRAFDLDVDQLAVNPKRPDCGAWKMAHGQTGMPRKNGRVNGPAMRGEVLGARTNNLRQIYDLARDQR